MRRDKADLPWGDETLLEHQAKTLRATGADELLISCRDGQVRECAGFRVVLDGHPDTGPAAALDDVWRATRADVLVVLPLDVPMMRAEYLRELAMSALQQQRSVVPMRGGFYEPLTAAWHRSCLVAFDQVMHRPMQEICRELATRELLVSRQVSDGETALFKNLNTPEDYERLRDRVKRST